MPKINENLVLIDYLQTISKIYGSFDPHMLNGLLTQNKIFTNFIASASNDLNFVYVSDINVFASDEVKNLYNQGNTIFFVNHFNDISVLDRLTIRPEGIREYTQTNLNRLTYESAKAKMANLDRYTLRVGKGLEIDFHNNNIKILMNVMLDEERTYRGKLNQILAFLPMFQEWDIERKQSIVQGLALAGMNEELRVNKLKQTMVRLNQMVSSGYAKRIEDKIAGLNRDIERSMEQIESLVAAIETARNDRFLQMINDNVDKVQKYLNFLERSPLISDIKLVERKELTEIIITTKLLYAHYIDKEKTARALPNLISDDQVRSIYYKALIQEQGKIGIGQYTINIGIQPNRLDYRIDVITEHYANEHLRRFNCYGNFSNPIAKAKSAMDLYALTNLLLQFLQTVNIGDPAGDRTISNSSYVIDLEGNLLHSKHEEESEADIR